MLAMNVAGGFYFGHILREKKKNEHIREAIFFFFDKPVFLERVAYKCTN